LRLDTLTAERIEDARLDTLAQSGYFERQVVPIPSAFRSSAFDLILRHVAAHAERFDDFEDPSRNGVMYSYDTDYFTSPDTEVLYSVIREVRPRTVVEVGCGNSTKVMRQAILDGGLNTRLISIDPHPRTQIVGLP